MALEAKDRPQSMQLWLEMLNYKSSIPNSVAKGGNVEAKNPTLTPPPPVEDTHKKEVVYLEPTIEKKTISNKSKSARKVPWVSLTILLLFSSLIGYILTAFNAPVLFWAVTVALAVAVARAGGAVAVAVAVAVGLAWAGVLAGAVARDGGAVAGALALAVAGTLTLALAVALAWALEESFSSVHTFLILTGTSNLGLGLGWIVHKFFTR